MANTDNTINYVEFPATDIEQTKQFYGDAFGWEFIDYGPDYVSFQGAGIDGGFTRGTAPSRGCGVLIVLYYRDLETLEARIRDLGCEVTREIFSFPGGRRFHFVDPNGNELAVWAE